MNYSESSSSNSSKASTSQDNSHLFCEPGPSRSNRQQPQQPQSQPQNQQQPPPINGGGGQSSSSGNNNNRNPNRNSEVLEYDLDALDNFPDPSPGDFDPSNSLSSSFPPIMDSHPGNFESQYLLICICKGVSPDLVYQGGVGYLRTFPKARTCPALWAVSAKMRQPTGQS